MTFWSRAIRWGMTGLVLVAFNVGSGAQEQSEHAGTADAGKVRAFFRAYGQADPRLVSGDFYQTPAMSEASGHPFCLDGDWNTGSVVIGGVRFDQLTLRYDITSHDLILNTSGFTGSYIQIRLKKDQISEFELEGRLFRPFPGRDPVSGIRFYESAVEGPAELMVLKTKSLKVAGGGIQDYYYQENRSLFIRTSEDLIPYRGKRSLYKLYPEMREELKSFIRENQPFLRRKTLDDQIRLIRFTNDLIQSAG